MGRNDAGPLTYILWEVLGPPWIGDLEVWGALANFFPVLTKAPGVEPIKVLDLSLGKKILWAIFVICPYVLDSEVFKIFGKDLFVTDKGPGLDPLYDRSSGNINRQGRNPGRRRDEGFPIGKYAVKSAKIIAVLAIVGVGFFTLTGVAGGSGYSDLIANSLGYQAAGVNSPAIGDTLAQAGKTVECLGNAACVRQWQFNNTQRPGSEEVGQEYSLEIENFDVNDGFPLDVANRRNDSRVPADFSVYNPRHGLKGIDATNVAYRIGVYDNIGSITGKPECKTEWKPLGGKYANSNLEENGTILPGGFATPLGTHSELTLGKCGLLQPALGLRRRVKLQIAYDYSSQSTLQVQAMSRQNMLSLDKRPSFKKSQTADTPVKTYVNVESPITYRINDAGSPESSIFGLRVGFETSQKGIKYRVNSSEFRLIDSGQTVDVDSKNIGSAVSCEDLSRIDESDEYNFSGEMSNYLKNRQSDSWFESGSGPSPARCSMVLENARSISPTGETLTFRIDANYTVMLEKMVDGFEAQNSRCTRFECPMLVPQSHPEARDNPEDDGLLSKCESSTRIDANNGCGARLGKDWPRVSADYAMKNELDSRIEEGETAYKLSNLMTELKNQDRSDSVINVTESDNISDHLGIDDSEEWNPNKTVVGAEQEKVEERGGKAIVSQNIRGQDIQVEQVDFNICQVNATEVDKAAEYWGEGNRGEVIYFTTGVADCESRIKKVLEKQLKDQIICGGKLAATSGSILLYNSITGDKALPDECESDNVRELVSPCGGGVKIMTRAGEIKCVQQG